MSSMSSPTACGLNPPTSISVVRRNTPKAPETMSTAPSGSQPMRPKRNERRYSMTCMSASGLRGSATSSRKPSRSLQPLAMRIAPPAATVSGFSRNGRTARISELRWSTPSASTIATSGLRQMLMPALAASALRAAVLLADDAQIAIARGAISRADGSARHLLAIGLRVEVELKTRDELLERVVGRAVVDDDDLEIRVLELQQRFHRGHDRLRLVVGGHDEADRQVHRRVRRIEIVDRGRLQVAANAADGEQALRKVRDVDRREVREKRPLDRVCELVRHQRVPVSAMACPRMSRA